MKFVYISLALVEGGTSSWQCASSVRRSPLVIGTRSYKRGVVRGRLGHCSSLRTWTLWCRTWDTVLDTHGYAFTWIRSLVPSPRSTCASKQYPSTPYRIYTMCENFKIYIYHSHQVKVLGHVTTGRSLAQVGVIIRAWWHISSVAPFRYNTQVMETFKIYHSYIVLYEVVRHTFGLWS